MVMYIIASKLNSTFGTIGSVTADKMIAKVRRLVSAIEARVQLHIWDVLFFLYGEHFLTFGATFFLWRDFLGGARLFFSDAPFFSGTTFFFRRDFLFLVRLFFFPAQLFFSGATL